MASSSTSVTRSKLFDHFVGMGFSDKLVSKAIEENGEGDSEAILNSILTSSDGNAPAEDILDSYWSSDEEDTNVGCAQASSSTSAARSKLFDHFVGMGFPDKLVSKAIEENGEENSEAILNSILTFSTLEESPPQQLSTSCSSDIETSDIESWFEDETETEDCLNGNGAYLSEKHKMLLSLRNGGSLSEREKKLLDLADMGYPLEVAETAMDRCGPEASVSDLTDFICAAQIARGEDYYFADDDLKPKHLLHGGSSANKKRKLLEMKRKDIEECIRLPIPMIGYGIPSMPSEQVRRPLPEEAKGPPYFYYENVALTPKGVWDTISRFLYNIEPEFVDSKYFCACARKRGYVHNLPIEGRFPLVPLPPLTVQQAFPLSKRWWPTWDTREKLNCIQTAIASAKLTERIRHLLEKYDDVPPEDVQRQVLEQCRKWNLVWVGKNKLAPLECDEVEMLLGFPRNHTRGGGISRTDRFKSLGNSFQVDTVAYHLSVLKDMYPEGINVLSLFSGIGGAEVALHRLGVKLKNVVSIEKTKANRDIVNSWWEQTNQKGSLIDFDDVQKFDADTVEQLVDTIGGFDLVVGGSPCNNLAGSNRVSRDGLEGKESSLFYDYFRILDLVKSVMRSRRH